MVPPPTCAHPSIRLSWTPLLAGQPLCQWHLPLSAAPPSLLFWATAGQAWDASAKSPGRKGGGEGREEEQGPGMRKELTKVRDLLQGRGEVRSVLETKGICALKQTPSTVQPGF